MAKKQIQVERRGAAWIVKGGGPEWAFKTEEEAVAKAKLLAASQRIAVVISGGGSRTTRKDLVGDIRREIEAGEYSSALSANPAERESFTLYLDPGDASSDVLRDVLTALSDLHLAAGGSGLTFKIDGHRVLIGEEAAR